VCYLDTFSPTPTHRIWNMQSVWDDQQTQNVHVAICLVSEDSPTWSGHIGPANYVDDTKYDI
jgi:hypothetical protein